jgi:hypothetical protein
VSGPQVFGAVAAYGVRKQPTDGAVSGWDSVGQHGRTIPRGGRIMTDCPEWETPSDEAGYDPDAELIEQARRWNWGDFDPDAGWARPRRPVLTIDPHPYL